MEVGVGIDLGYDEADDIEKVKMQIFGGLLQQDEGTQERRLEFGKVFNDPSIFKDEYYVLAAMLKEYGQLRLSDKFLENYIRVNRPKIEKSPHIDIQKYREGEEEPFYGFVDSIKLVYEGCMKEEVDKEGYNETLEIYKMNYVVEGSIKVLAESTAILSEGIGQGSRAKVGYDDMRSHMKQGFLKLDSLTNKSERKGAIVYGVNDEADADAERDGIKKICNFGIPSLDKNIGGIYEDTMISVLAPTKGGKSRFVTSVLHNAVIEGKTILMWSIENGYKGFEALIRARHFEYYHNDLKAESFQDRTWVDDDNIRKGNLKGKEKDLELTSWTDLKTNPTYGKIVNMDEDIDLETFIETIDMYVEEYDVDLICIDYLQLMQSNNSGLSKNEVISRAYQSMLQYIKGKHIAGIFPGQLKQTVVDGLNKTDTEDLVNTELRSAAGESYEVVKTPDVNLMIYATQQQMSQGIMRILPMPSRNNAIFDPVLLKTQLGTCTFVEDKVG